MLAVICNVGERPWTKANLAGRMWTPQTVLKTAGLTSTNVRQRPLEFDSERANSVLIRQCPYSSGILAVMLAVRSWYPATTTRARLYRDAPRSLMLLATLHTVWTS